MYIIMMITNNANFVFFYLLYHLFFSYFLHQIKSLVQYWGEIIVIIPSLFPTFRESYLYLIIK